MCTRCWGRQGVSVCGGVYVSMCMCKVCVGVYVCRCMCMHEKGRASMCLCVHVSMSMHTSLMYLHACALSKDVGPQRAHGVYNFLLLVCRQLYEPNIWAHDLPAS